MTGLDLHGPLFTALRPEHEAFRERVREVTREWTPAVVEGWEQDGHLPSDVFLVLGKAGLFRERWASGWADGLPYGVVLAEELGLVAGGLGLAGTLHSEVFIGTLDRAARSAEQRTLLEDALDGTVVGCFAVTEPTGGSDIGGVRTTARRTEHGWWIEGEKRFISNAGSASHALLLARCVGEPQAAALSALVVPLRSPGVELTGFYPKLGTNSCDAGHIRLDVELGHDALVGTVGTGLAHVMHALQAERIAVSSQLVVAMRVAVRLATAWARRRTQYGRPLFELQAISHRLADATAEVWSCEALLNSVLLAAEQRRPLARPTAALKLVCAGRAGRVIDDAMQVLGGRGYTANYPLERLWRDVRLARIGAGTDEVMREIVAAGIDRNDPWFDGWLDDLDIADLPVPYPIRGKERP